MEDRERQNMEEIKSRLDRKDRRPRKKNRGMEEEESSPRVFFRVFFLGILGLLLVAALLLGGLMAKEYYRKSTDEGEMVTITIDKGDDIREIADKLVEAGVIRYHLPFLLKAYRTRGEKNIRYGTFEVSRGMSLEEIIKVMSKEAARKGKNILMVPEGYSVEQIARRLEEQGFVKAGEFLNAVKNYSGDFAFADALPDKDSVDYTLQGFLYPDTYYLDESMTSQDLIMDMLTNFEKHFDKTRMDRAEAMGMSPEEVIIRASLIQKETILEEEYPTVAGVLQNRLDKGMKLQLDSTVVYAVTKGLYGKQKVYHNDLKVESPYNTYLHKGLPPGPICNPGLGAIDGVLNAEDHDYLFFQTDMKKKDGSNLYFKTYEEHSSAQATATETETVEEQTEEQKQEKKKPE